jgi:hypothetical protein
MAKNTAVCIRCGAFKKKAFGQCPQCEFQPTNDYEAARSLILAEKQMIGDLEVGQTPEQLHEIAAAIRAGRPFPIDGELQKQVVRAYYQYKKSLPQPKWPLRRLMKWALIMLVVIAVIAVAAWYMWLR